MAENEFEYTREGLIGKNMKEIDGYIELISESAASICISGWRRMHQAGLQYNIRLDLELNGELDREIAAYGDCLYFKRDDLSHNDRSFLVVVSKSYLHQSSLGIDVVKSVAFQDGAKMAPTENFQLLSRQSHLNAISAFALIELPKDAAHWWAELEDSDPLSSQNEKEVLSAIPQSLSSINVRGTKKAQQSDKQAMTEIKTGMIESIGPLLILGWIRTEENESIATLSLRTPSGEYLVTAELNARPDLSVSALGFDARTFAIPIPADIPATEIHLIVVELNGAPLQHVKSFIVKTPILFRLESVANGLIKGVFLDLRQPNLKCTFRVCVANHTVATVQTSIQRQISVNGSIWQGEFGFSFDIADSIGPRRTEVTFQLYETSITLGDAIIDGTFSYRSFHKAPRSLRALGKVDQVGPHFVGGWVHLTSSAEPVIELRINGAPFQRVTARRHRPDVVEATGQDARGFLIAVPKRRLSAGDNKIEVWDLHSKSILPSVTNILTGPQFIGTYEVLANGITGTVNSALIRTDSCIEVLFNGRVVFEQRLSLEASREPQSFFIPAPARRIDELRTSVRLMPANLPLTYVENRKWGLRGKLRSNFEGLHNGSLTGWLFDDRDETRHLSVLIIMDGKILAEIMASETRTDLLSTGITSLNHGFRLPMPAALLDGRTHVLDVIELATRTPLVGSPSSVEFPRNYPDLPKLLTTHLNAFRPPRLIAQRTAVRTSHTPDFSLIILNKDAGEVLERALESIEDYLHKHSMEIIVVDHDSADSSRDIIRKWSNLLPLRYIWQNGNNTFSFSNNYAATFARGRRLVFVNNDIVFTQDVLANVADFMDEHHDVGLVGIKLLELRKTAFAEALNEFKTHHLGIGFVEDPNTGRIRPAEIVDDADNAWRSFTRCDVASVTGAFCVIEANDYAAIGGFDERFFYGYEDVALGLNVRTKLQKRVVSLNDVTSFHHRGFMRLSGKMPADFMQRVRHNDEILDKNYSREIRRSFRRSLFAGDCVYNVKRFTVAFIVYESGPTAEAGDLFTAQELAAELVKSLDCEVMFVSAADDWTNLSLYHVIVNMRNEFDIRDAAKISPCALRIAWMRNNFEDWLESQTLFEYDFVLCSSLTFIDELYTSIGIVAEHLEIATNIDAMSQGIVRRDLKCDVIFNGSFAGANRTLASEWDGITLPFSFKVVGSGWQGSPLERFWHGSLPYDKMPDVYASCAIVIDDANTSARKWGGTNSRVFDATAAKRVVLTNSVQSSTNSFEGKLPVWTTGQNLIAQIQSLLSNEPARLRLAAELSEVTAARHSYADRARKLTTLIRSGAKLRRIVIKIAAPSENTPEVWGDLHFALLLATELRRLKYSVKVETRDRWNSSASYPDVNLVLRGLSAAPQNRSAVNLLWVISHPNDVSRAELANYDHVFGASVESCRRFAEMGALSTSLLPQCAAKPNSGIKFEHSLNADLLYVGNTRGVLRDGIRLLEQTGLNYSLAGYGWENFVSVNKIIAERIPYEQVCGLYGQAKVVVNDHWPDMKEWGILSNRVFDVLAAGGFVITDLLPGLEAVVGESVPMYKDAASMSSLVERALADEEWRVQMSRTGQTRVLAEHTFEKRAVEIDKRLKAMDI